MTTRFGLWLTITAFGLATFAVAADRVPVSTSRTGTKILNAPVEPIAPSPNVDAFSFVVIGDRTTGPQEGIEILATAVDDVNRFRPAFVMNVGDMVQGYNVTEKWIAQMNEFQAVMNRLEMPWFPTPGNHDLYWRGDGRPPREHEEDFEQHFGPLWYSFRYGNSGFIVLCSDEGDAETGEKNFSKASCQKMSEAQFAWLKKTLASMSDAANVFLFLHHPRWRKGGYGNDWDKVHDVLVAAKNVRTVFAGHIHNMTHAEKDGIEYTTLGTTGGDIHSVIPEAGMAHEFRLVNVRRNEKLTITSIRAGATVDYRAFPNDFQKATLEAIRNKTELPTPPKHIPALAL
ncbi:MAG: metallophosphoesterase family protein [Thermoguttaceae bacterium]